MTGEPSAWDAAVALLTAPFPLLLLALLAGAVWVTSRVERAEDPCAQGHAFRHRHPSGLWRCTRCPAVHDRHGRHL